MNNKKIKKVTSTTKTKKKYLKNYNNIWKKIERLMNIDFDS